MDPVHLSFSKHSLPIFDLTWFPLLVESDDYLFGPFGPQLTREPHSLTPSLPNSLTPSLPHSPTPSLPHFLTLPYCKGFALPAASPLLAGFEVYKVLEFAFQSE